MPHMAMHQAVTTYTNDGNGDFTGVSSAITNTERCRFKVRRTPAHCYMNCHNFGRDIVLGPENDGWDMSSSHHSIRLTTSKMLSS